MAYKGKSNYLYISDDKWKDIIRDGSELEQFNIASNPKVIELAMAMVKKVYGLQKYV